MDMYGDCRLNLCSLWQNEVNIRAQRGGDLSLGIGDQSD